MADLGPTVADLIALEMADPGPHAYADLIALAMVHVNDPHVRYIALRTTPFEAQIIEAQFIEARSDAEAFLAYCQGHSAPFGSQGDGFENSVNRHLRQIDYRMAFAGTSSFLRIAPLKEMDEDVVLSVTTDILPRPGRATKPCRAGEEE